jgi:hypothetical protein
MEDGEQPSVYASARRKLRALFERAYAGGLHQLFGNIPVARQNKSVTPESCQMGCKLQANLTGGDFLILAVNLRILDVR